MTPSPCRTFARTRLGQALPLAFLCSLVLFVTAASATSYTNTGTIVINELNPAGPATPYPSDITVASLTGTVTKVTVTLNGFDHTRPSDVDVLLVGPAGQTALVMSDVGGTTAVSGLTITLDDTAGSSMTAAALTSTTYKPTNLQTDYDSFPPPAPLPSPFPVAGSALSVFDGSNPNGTWRLYVGDDTSGMTGSITGGWSLAITTDMTAETPFSNASPITINDRPSGVLVSSPYPSPIAVLGFAGTVGEVTVILSGLSHTFPSDIDILLVGPTGGNATIMSDVGDGANVDNITITLDDDAASPMTAAALVTGTYQPTNVGGGDPFPSPAPIPSGGSALSVFDGIDPNGTWDLYVVDGASLDGGYLLGGWSLDITGPTAVEVASLKATPGPAGVLVSWRTQSEMQIAGFNVYRGATKLNGSLIASKHAGQARGAAYRFLDRRAKRPGSSVYRLQVVRRDGTRSFAGSTTLTVSG